MALDLAGAAACFKWHFKIVHCCQLFDRFDELELVVVHQEVDRVAVRATSKAVVKLFLTVNGEGRGFLVVEWTTRVEILALLFQLHTGIDQIDDVSACQQIINEYAWDSSSNRPRFLAIHKRK